MKGRAPRNFRVKFCMHLQKKKKNVICLFVSWAEFGKGFSDSQHCNDLLAWCTSTNMNKIKKKLELNGIQLKLNI